MHTNENMHFGYIGPYVDFANMSSTVEVIYGFCSNNRWFLCEIFGRFHLQLVPISCEIFENV